MVASTSVNYSNAVTVSKDTDSKIDEELLKIMDNLNRSELISIGVRIEDLDGAIINKMIETIVD